MGLTLTAKGSIVFDGKDISKLTPYEIANHGIGYVPEDQGIFAQLTVEENMRVAIRKETESVMQKQEYILELFPDLKSFGKSMVAIYRVVKSRCWQWRERL